VKTGRDIMIQQRLIEQQTGMRVYRRIVECVGYEARRRQRGELKFTEKLLFCFFQGMVAQQVLPATLVGISAPRDEGKKPES